MDHDLSEDEAARLSAVHECALLDTPAHDHFDAVVRLAAQACDAPVAALGLLDRQRLWFKARLGLTEAELPREASLACETLAAPQGVLVVNDLNQAPAWADHPLRGTVPHWRFYAGAALHDANQHALGTLFVAHTKPHALTPTQTHALRDLACVARRVIEAHVQGLTLARQAITDPITALSNRAHFDQTLVIELSHAMRYGEPFTVLYMDLDGFKEINDGFGHAAGMDVLRCVAQRLTQQVRVGDVIARFGIDEFGVVMRHGNRESADVLARRIIKAVSDPITLATGDTVGVGISVGMAQYTDTVDSVHTLMQHAEQALYQAKKQNERRWKMFMGIR